MTERPTAVQLMLTITAGPTAPERLAVALARASVASVIVVGDGREPLSVATVRPLVAAAQAAGAAALIEDDAELARTIRADGVHLRGGAALDPDAAMAAVAEARSILGGRFIVGAEAGPSRHSAMVLGEAGADYVAFGDIAYNLHPGADPDEPLPDRVDRLAWWSEIFEVPCVAIDVATAEEVEACAAAGADFVAIEVPTAIPAADIDAFLAECCAALTEFRREDA